MRWSYSRATSQNRVTQTPSWLPIPISSHTDHRHHSKCIVGISQLGNNVERHTGLEGRGLNPPQGYLGPQCVGQHSRGPQAPAGGANLALWCSGMPGASWHLFFLASCLLLPGRRERPSCPLPVQHRVGHLVGMATAALGKAQCLPVWRYSDGSGRECETELIHLLFTGC